MKKQLRILFLGKANDEHCDKALNLLRRNVGGVTAGLSEWGDPFPQAFCDWEGDYIVSYLSRWIVPADLLRRAGVAAINFHPAPPSFPGVGCNNFALYEGVDEFGVTCHYMNPKVDTGEVVAVKRFPVYPEDDVASLLSRTYDYQLILFYEMFHLMCSGERLPKSSETWARKPYTRTEFNSLFTIDPSMNQEEIGRRVRATSFRGYNPEVLLGKYRFVYQGNENEASP